MYDYPILFPSVSNRETWLQFVQISDDQTGDPISLTASNGTALYAIYLEIWPPRYERSFPYYGQNYSSYSYYYDDCGDPVIMASLADYLTIPDTGVIQIKIPYTVMQTLFGGKTYDVFLRIEDTPNSDARQILIGKLPVTFGGVSP